MTRETLERQIVRVLRAPVIVWVLLGLSVSYWLYFIWPIFLAGGPMDLPVWGGPMQFPQYIPSAPYIGVDLRSDVDASEKFFTNAQTPYVNNNQYAYPPLTLLLIAPLVRVGWPLAYGVMAFINVVCVVVIAFLIPLSFSRPRPISTLLLLALLIGLFCYGFQFELERGQLNLIAVALCFVAIWIYHQHHRYRYLAYVCFCLGVQLKVYPAIFVLLLVQDWRAWGANLRRFVALGVVNVAALFVFGVDTFKEFFAAITDHASNPYIWAGNHSARSFTWWVAHLRGEDQVWPTPMTLPLQYLGLALAVGCLGLLWLLVYRRRQPGVNPMLLLGCTLCALVIPGASHDYTLSYLIGAVALMFARADTWAVSPGLGRQALQASLILAFAGAWGTTLVSYSDKPLALFNNFPALQACWPKPHKPTYPSPLPQPPTSLSRRRSHIFQFRNRVYNLACLPLIAANKMKFC